MQEKETATKQQGNEDFASIDFEAISSQKISGDSSPDKGDGKKMDMDIDPAFAIYVLDIFISRIISVGGKFAGYEIKVSDVCLTKTEINNLKPYAAKALERMISWLENHEIFMFFFMLTITYGSKAVLHSKKVEKGKKQTPPKDQKPAPKPRARTSKRINKTNKIKK